MIGPAIVDGHRRADLVEHLDQRREAGLDRVQGQDPLGERVQGADRGGVEVVQRKRGTLPVLRSDSLSARGLLERGAEPVAQLGAAFSVNVTAAMCSSGTPSRSTRVRTRSTSALVLPEPAPASTNSV